MAKKFKLDFILILVASFKLLIIGLITGFIGSIVGFIFALINPIGVFIGWIVSLLLFGYAVLKYFKWIKKKGF